jgi:hypothetical protein
MNMYQKRTKPLADNDALGSFLLLTGTIAARPGGTPWPGPVLPVDGYKPQTGVGGG